MHKRLMLLALTMGLCLACIAGAANIVLVNETYDADGNGAQDDLGLEEFLIGLGHQVDIQRGNWTTLDATKIATLNAADLIVVSRATGSGNYDDDSTEIANWNGLTSPLILLTSYLSRGTSSNYRWYWLNSNTINNLTGPMMQVVVPTHQIFRGVPLDANNQVGIVDGTTGTGQTSFAGTTDVGNGTLLARTATGTNSWIVEWEAGTPYYTGSPGTPAGKRMLFCFGTQESGATPQGAFNLTKNGKRLFTNAINYMAGIEGAKSATDPVPADEARDVARDIVLGWTPNARAATHNVYFGMDADAVANATTAEPLGVLVSRNQDANTYEPVDALQLGQTYYWRVDEVNGAPDYTVFTGDVWSFTVEPVSYVIPTVRATASSATGNMGPENTVNGLGLAGDQHSGEPTQMWFSVKDAPEPTWIQYEFDAACKLDHVQVWNSNQTLESTFGFGAKDVTIEYGNDGVEWGPLGDFVFAQAPGNAAYTGEAINLDGIVARHVRLTINSNWDGVFSQYSLSEVRFFYIPTRARKPAPAADANEVAVDTVLTWRAGREAVSHQVYFSTDRPAVVERTAATVTVTDNHFDPGSLTFGTTYYWRVDEVNEAETPGVWEGDVWSFSTKQYEVIDHFESYTGELGSRIYEFWIDGVTNGASASQVGYDSEPFAEQATVHGGNQSMPLLYDNGGTFREGTDFERTGTPFFSEAARVWDKQQDWTANGADTLSLYFRGNPISLLESAGGITLSGGGADIWDVADECRFAWKSLTGDGSIVARIESLDNTSDWAKAGLMIRDSLDPGAKNALAYVTVDGRVGWQFRLIDVGTSDSTRSEPAAVTLPHWLRLTRTGNTIKAEHSSDAVTWQPMTETANPTEPTSRDFAMNSTVYIGLAVTSHDTALIATAEFSDVSTSGTVTGAWQVEEIGISQPVNDPAQLYLTVQDSAGKTKTVVHDDPAATTIDDWQQWRIPLSEFTSADVNMAKVKKLCIGVGDAAHPTPGGRGLLYIDDIGCGHPLE